MENLKQIADEKDMPANRPIKDTETLYSVAEAYKRNRMEATDVAVRIHGVVMPFLSRVARAGGRKCRIDPWSVTAGESDALYLAIDKNSGKVMGTPELRIEAVVGSSCASPIETVYSLRYLLAHTAGIVSAETSGAFGKPCIDVKW